MRVIDERPQNKHLIHDSETQRRRATRHGFYHESWYPSYRGMMQRCNLPSAGNYQFYGGRGISVCGEWHDISNFAEWVKTSGYKPGLTIDRIDPTENCCPQKRRWVLKGS